MIIATYMIKNDEDIIGDSVEYHLNNGVDAFIITEHNANEKVVDILDKYDKYIIKRINITDPAYYQNKIVTEMARLAADYNPDWIVHCDADELWQGLDKLKFKDHKDKRVFLTRCWYNYLPYSTDEFNIKDVKYCEYPIKKSIFGMGMQSKRKILHKPDKNISIGMGNHTIQRNALENDNLEECDVEIHHYPIRTYKQFEKKVVDGAMAYSHTDFPYFVGRHWKNWYNEYSNGRLLDVYKSFLLSDEQINQKINEGYDIKCVKSLL